MSRVVTKPPDPVPINTAVQCHVHRASGTVSVLTQESAIALAERLKALADPTRLQILNLLRRQEDAVSVFEIVAKFSLGQPTISHHLRILRDVGLINFRKSGAFTYYYVCQDVLEAVRQAMESLA